MWLISTCITDMIGVKAVDRIRTGLWLVLALGRVVFGKGGHTKSHKEPWALSAYI